MYKQFKPTINLDDLNDNEAIIQPIQQRQQQELNPINQNPDRLKEQQLIDSSMTLDTNNNNNVNGANTTTTIIMDRKMKKRK